MEQFALASVYPRSIAWLIRSDEWERFEVIVKYNCAMVGGYFNVFIPLTDEDTLSENYRRFLIDYDPHLVVLAPGMKSEFVNTLHSLIHPFAIIPWEKVPQVAILDPWSGGLGINATLGADTTLSSSRSLVAVANDKCPDASRLALVACGDVEPREPMWHVMDEVISLNATGHREMFLMRVLKPEFIENRLVEARVNEEGNIHPAPNRYQLSNLIEEGNQFPLVDAIERQECCCRLQHHVATSQSFAGLTAFYKRSGTPRRIQQGSDTPSVVMLVSNNFGLEEAILFWNLRASGFFVTWLSFAEIESNTDALIKWLESDYGGGFYSLVSGGLDIAFASHDGNLAHLEVIFGDLLGKRQKGWPDWRIVSYEDIVFYNYIRPNIKQERVSVVESAGKYTFIPKLPLPYRSGIYTVVLEWNGLMLPQSDTVVSNLVSSETVKGFLPHFRNGRRVEEEAVVLPKFRLTMRRYLEAQIDSDEPINFEIPFPEKVVETVFRTARYSRIELSSTARYHRNFLERIGGLEKSQQYLAAFPYRQLLELLSDNKDKRQLGWILDYPSKRRALHHLHLWEALGKAVPPETKSYFNTISDMLPEEALDLLEKGILERGFVLRCTSCSYRSWYPAEHVGQTFECTRCFQTQIYRSNPLWLYKLPEVIFQGFEDNMQVPLLALHHLKCKSQHSFDWVPDSNVYWVENSNEIHKNVDILCLCDGKLYIGEAKSSDEIEANQFSFYEGICRHVAIDGVVFATSKSQWKRATLQRIEPLKTQFSGEVLVLTGQDLYPVTPLS